MGAELPFVEQARGSAATERSCAGSEFPKQTLGWQFLPKLKSGTTLGVFLSGASCNSAGLTAATVRCPKR